MGGGRRWFLPSGTFGSSRSAGTDYEGLPADLPAGWSLPATAASAKDPGRNLLADFQAPGSSYADSTTSLDGLVAGGAPQKLLGLFGYGNMNVALDKMACRPTPTCSSSSCAPRWAATAIDEPGGKRRGSLRVPMCRQRAPG